MEKNFQIHKALVEYYGHEVKHKIVSKLNGMTNSTYRVLVNNTDLVITLPCVSSNELVDRTNAFSNQLLIKDRGVDIPLLYWNDKGVRISRFHDNKKELNLIQSIKEISHKLKKLHTSDVKFKSEFNIKELINKYEKILNKTEEIDIKYFKIKQKVSKYQFEYSLSPCHNDLVPENFIYENNEIYIIDWEYSGMNDSLFDIASFVAEWGLKKDNRDILYKEYFGRKITREEEKRINIYMTSQNILWYLWANIMTQEGKNFKEYGQLRLEQAIKGAYNI